MLLQVGAMQMQILARGFFVYELTGSPTLLGVVSAATALPALAFGLFGGVLADRMERKRIIQVGLSVSALMALAIAVSITTDTITWQHLLVASLVQGTIMPMILPARQAIIPQLVRKERLMNAIALNSMGRSIVFLVAPAVAGGLIAVIGVGGVYYLMAGMYLGAMFFTGLLPALERTSRGPTVAIIAELVEGLRYILANAVILQLLLFALFTTMLSMPIMFIFPIFAKDVFAVGPVGLGAMTAMMGAGSLAGALLIASLRRLERRGFLMAGAGVISGGALLGFSIMSFLAPVYWASLGFLVLIGLLQSSRMTLNNSLVMEYVDEQYRGRIMSIFTLNFSLVPAGVLPITIAAEFIGAPLAVGVMAALLIVAAGIMLATSPQLRRLA